MSLTDHIECIHLTAAGLHCRLIGSPPTFAGNAEFDSDGPIDGRRLEFRLFGDFKKTV